MVLSAKILSDVNSVNSFEFTDRLETVAGSEFTLYFQLIDASKNKDGLPPGLRYVPADAATLSVVLENIDAAKRITRPATQPFDGDWSVWSVDVLSSDSILPGTISLKLTLVEGGVTRKGLVMNAISVTPQDL